MGDDLGAGTTPARNLGYGLCMSETTDGTGQHLPEPWKLYDAGTGREYWYRQCDGLAAGLIAALSQLPPGTAIETSTGPEGTGTPDDLWYYPHLRYVTI